MFQSDLRYRYELSKCCKGLARCNYKAWILHSENIFISESKIYEFFATVCIDYRSADSFSGFVVCLPLETFFCDSSIDFFARGSVTLPLSKVTVPCNVQVQCKDECVTVDSESGAHFH